MKIISKKIFIEKFWKRERNVSSTTMELQVVTSTSKIEAVENWIKNVVSLRKTLRYFSYLSSFLNKINAFRDNHSLFALNQRNCRGDIDLWRVFEHARGRSMIPWIYLEVRELKIQKSSKLYDLSCNMSEFNYLYPLFCKF